MDKELTGNSIQLKVSNFMFVYLLFTWMRQTGQERRSKYEQSSTLLQGRQIMSLPCFKFRLVFFQQTKLLQNHISPCWYDLLVLLIVILIEKIRYCKLFLVNKFHIIRDIVITRSQEILVGCSFSKSKTKTPHN